MKNSNTNEKFQQLSKELKGRGQPHQFFIFNPNGHFDFYGYFDDDDACAIIEQFAKDRGIQASALLRRSSD